MTTLIEPRPTVAPPSFSSELLGDFPHSDTDRDRSTPSPPPMQGEEEECYSAGTGAHGDGSANPISKAGREIKARGITEARLETDSNGSSVLKQGVPHARLPKWQAERSRLEDDAVSRGAGPVAGAQDDNCGSLESKVEAVRMNIYAKSLSNSSKDFSSVSRDGTASRGIDPVSHALDIHPSYPNYDADAVSPGIVGLGAVGHLGQASLQPVAGPSRLSPESSQAEPPPSRFSASSRPEATPVERGRTWPSRMVPPPVDDSHQEAAPLPDGSGAAIPRRVQRSSTLVSNPDPSHRTDASTSRLPPSPTHATQVKRTQSYSPAQLVRPASSAPPLRRGSGDEFEDEVARQAEAIRKERQTRKMEQEKEEEQGKRRASAGTGEPERVLVGNLIGEGHANYVLMYNMLTGIRIGVSRCQAKLKRPLTDDDYTARHKFSFDIVGNELTPSAKYDFKFKDYAPWVFREMREYFHLDPADYLLSLTAKYILSELGSPGKSGSFFYFSRDYRFIIKTIHHTEHKFLRRILKQYHEHIKQNPHTLLSRFYGLHRVKLPHGRKIHFVIMNNLFPPHRDVHETYDLKGSAVGREYPEEKAARKPGAVLKDLNWVHRRRVIDVGPEKRALFEEQLRRDTELLQRLGIMDYSLLIGFHDVTRGNRDKIRDDQLKVFQPDTVKVRRPTQVRRDQEHAASALRKAVQQSDPKALSEKHRLPDKDRSERRHFIFYQDEGGFQATDDENNSLPTVYYLGIIDILTPYSTVKKLEHFWKGLSSDKHMISAVPPVEYGNRFLAFLFSVIRGGDPSTRPNGLESVPASPPAPLAPTSAA